MHAPISSLFKIYANINITLLTVISRTSSGLTSCCNRLLERASRSIFSNIWLRSWISRMPCNYWDMVSVGLWFVFFFWISACAFTKALSNLTGIRSAKASCSYKLKDCGVTSGNCPTRCDKLLTVWGTFASSWFVSFIWSLFFIARNCIWLWLFRLSLSMSSANFFQSSF